MKVLDLFQAFLEQLWSLNLLSIGSHKKVLESEVERLSPYFCVKVLAR
ncbi:hypothetical protein GGQ00_002828 [Salinibacter ruber]|nr:hypothetical protein [Salinibacter ruber]MCS4174883.1 hypothetical protein [Salinibacter ruber]